MKRHLCFIAVLLASVICGQAQIVPTERSLIPDPFEAENRLWGRAVACAGEHLVVGSPADGGAEGAVHIYAKGATGWSGSTLVARLRSPGSMGLGQQVTADRNTIVATDFRQVFVFVKPATGWVDAGPTAILSASDGAQYDLFGITLALDGDVLGIGAPSHGQADGAVYLYERPTNGWATATETVKLSAPVTGSAMQFGMSVGIAGDTLVVGASTAPFQENRAGAAFVYTKGTSGWSAATQVAKLVSSDLQAYDLFGDIVAIESDTILVAATAGDGQTVDTGAVYLYEKPATGWADGTETAKLTGSTSAKYDVFGCALAKQGDTIVVGARRASLGNTNHGGAYVFVKPATGWTSMTESGTFKGSVGSRIGGFGSVLALTDDTLIVGAPLRDTLNRNAGGVFVFKWTTLAESGDTNVGGTRILSMNAPLAAGATYQVGTAFGTGPLPLGDRTVGLAFDGLLYVSAFAGAPTVFGNYRGTLDASGQATATIQIQDIPATVGYTLHSAFITLDATAPDGIFGISNTTSFVITP